MFAVPFVLAAVVVLDVKTGKVLSQDGDITTPSRPGSTIKPFVLLALEKAGLLENSGSSCQRTLRVAGRNFDCVHGDASGTMSPGMALAYSCNSWFAERVRHLKPGLLQAELAHAGLGPVQTPATPDALVLQALGEDAFQVSPLSLARAYRRLALAKNSTILAGLRDGVKFGTARRAAIDGVPTWGKTGTTSTHQAWFAGFSQDRVVVVRLKGGSGGADAAPLARAYLLRRSSGPEPLKVRLASGVRLMSLEDYTASVLEGEAGEFRSGETLKAMSVLARTFAVANRGRHRWEGYDFCATTHCQFLRTERPPAWVTTAVAETEGETLWYGGQRALVYYHRNCGGATEPAGNLWTGSDRPYLQGVQDTFCQGQGGAPWRSEVSLDQLRKALGRPDLRVFEAAKRSMTGRVLTYSVGSEPLRAELVYSRIGQSLGWGYLKSNLVQVVRTATGVSFNGRGSGHGVGLCQTGAGLRGEAGHSYSQILEAYFPGTQTGLTPQGLRWERRAGERVDVQVPGGIEDAGLVALADRLLNDAERRTGIPVTARPRIQIYPSVEAYRDSTGEPGGVAAVTRGSHVRMQPIEVLRARGVVEATLLHELIHVSLNFRTGKPLPEWFEEGLAQYLTDPNATLSQEFRHSRERVAKLVQAKGRSTVLGWVSTGLPKSAD